MGNERAIIMSGTMIASVILIVGVMFAMPSTVDLKTQSTAMTILGHWELVIADPQGNVIHYIQVDNFPTDLLKNEAQEVIFVGTANDANPMDFIALGTNGLVNTFTSTQVDATSLNEEVATTTGRCDGTPVNTAATGGNDASTEVQCTITINSDDDNETLIEVALFDSLLASGTNEMGSVATIDPTVLLQTGMTIDSTVTFTFG